MKIVTTPESVSPSLRTPGRRSTTTSFAQLLERGTQARSVMSHRALGFSETGILGVHFAHQQGRSFAPTASASQDIAQSVTLPAAGQGATREQMTAAPEAAGTPNLENHGTPLGQRSGAAALPALPVSDAKSPPAAMSSRAATTGASDQASPEVSHLARVRAPAPPPRRRSPFQVRLVGVGAELVVILEGARGGDESILELEATARAVASEYCMVISHLFVKPNGNGTAA